MATKRTTKASSATTTKPAKRGPKGGARATASTSNAGATTTHAGPFTLAIDIGGTGLKASVLDRDGAMVTERVRVETPQPCNPKVLVDALGKLVSTLPTWDRISVGFPGLIRHGVIITAPNLGTDAFAGFDLSAALTKRLGAPCRAVNDADMQGLAAINGEGVEMVITLGTGFGTALFMDGVLQVHLELAHHPFRKATYDILLGERGRQDAGKKKWLKLVDEAIGNLRVLTNFDHLYIGGGNAKRLDADDLAKDITLVDNAAGILGGIRLWDDKLAHV